MASISDNPRSNGSSLHVLTITPFFPFAANPVYGSFISEPIQHFAEFGLDSTVIGVSPLHRRRRYPVPSAVAEWMRYPQFPGNGGLPAAGKFLYRRLASHVRKLHEHKAIDVIHAHAALPCGHAAFLLAASLNLPFVVTVHGLDVFNECFQPGSYGARRRASLSAEVYRRAASVICISRAVEKLLKEGMRQPVSSRVIYNGTDTELFSPVQVDQKAPTILVVGNLLGFKGHEVVLKAMAAVGSQFPTLNCNIIGEGADKDRFTSLARELGIADRVVFLGRQSRSAVAQAMRECTIFALPSRFEGLGCVYLEAMACGKPIVACQGQGIGEVIEHQNNGWLIPADDVEAASAAFLRLLNSADLRERIGSAARQTILNGLTLKDQVRQLSDLYRTVVEQ